jgi:Protein of unknown function (DUF3618)
VPEARSPATVRREIAAERQRLADAVDDLRARLGDAADVKTHVRTRLRSLAPAAFAAGFVIAGGIGATMRLLARRSRER